jgi:hypothetical protein
MRTSLGVELGAVVISAGLAFAAPVQADQPPPKHPMAQEHPIEFDARALIPPVYWSVPGVTEPLQSVRGRLMTDKATTLRLKPGRYMYMTTTFAFEFTVNLDGIVDYSKIVEHCLGGRGTTTVIVKCHGMGNVAGPD